MLEERFQPDALFTAATYLQGQSVPLPLRVLHVHTAAAWEYGLTNYLSHDADLQVRDLPVTKESILLGELTHFNPNVILLNTAAPLSVAHLRRWPSDQLAPALVRFIVIDLQDNVIDIHDAQGKRHFVVTHITDLSQCIHGQYQM